MYEPGHRLQLIVIIGGKQKETVVVNSLDDLSTLKRTIALQLNLNGVFRSLKFNGQDLTKGNLEWNNIRDGSTLEVVIGQSKRIKIYVRRFGHKTHTFHLCSSSSIVEFRQLIGNEFGVDVGEQYLMFNGNYLMDGTLEQNSLQDGSIVWLFMNKVNFRLFSLIDVLGLG